MERLKNISIIKILEAFAGRTATDFQQRIINTGEGRGVKVR